MNKIMFIFGTRPEFIKLYPVIKEFEKNGMEVITLNTGQHKEMLNDLMANLNFKETYNLEVMNRCNGLMDILTSSLSGINKIVEEEKPNMIFVHGDTSATLAGSISAFYNQIRLGHIEAGLRTYNKYSPFPEEVNRQITGVIADYHFAPTTLTYNNLIKENKNKDNIFIVGNTAIDMLNYTITENYENSKLDFLDKKYILITAHRRENIEVMNEIFKALNELAKNNSEYEFIYPIHLNPLIREKAMEYLNSSNIKIIEPLDTIDFHNVLKKSYFVITDSGGIQEEAPALNKPVLVIRDTTERTEGIEAGTLKLIGTKHSNIVKEVQRLIDDKEYYEEIANCKNPYGDGTTSKQIIDIVKKLEF